MYIMSFRAGCEASIAVYYKTCPVRLEADQLLPGVLQQGQSYVEKQDDKTVKEWMRQQVRIMCVGDTHS